MAPKRKRTSDENDENRANKRVKSDYEWVLPIVHNEGGRSYYSKINIMDTVFSVGQTVCIKINAEDVLIPKNKKAKSSKIVKEPEEHVTAYAQIAALYEDHNDSSKKVTLMWYETTETLPAKDGYTLAQHEMIYAARKGDVEYGKPHSKELFETDVLNDYDIACINEELTVVPLTEYAILANKNNVDECTYFCRAIWRDGTRSVMALPDVPKRGDFDKGRLERLCAASEIARLCLRSAAAPVPAAPAKGRGRKSAAAKANGIMGTDDKYAYARAQLHLDSHPDQLPCREKETEAITEFLRGALESGGNGNVMYMSGMPGTGKTASVRNVCNALKREAAEPGNRLHEFKLVELNAMRLPHPNAAFQEIYKQLFNKRPPNCNAAYQKLDQYFGKPDPKKPVCVLVVDELDYLVTKKQKVLYTLFDWPTKRAAKLAVIAIANTLDLPDRMIPRCASRLGFGKLNFQAYDKSQIQIIVKQRLENCNGVFEEPAIQLAASKVAAYTGDVRKAFQICRLALDIREEEGTPTVTPNQVLAASNSIYATPAAEVITKLPLLCKLFLTSIVLELNKKVTEYAAMQQVFRRLKNQASTLGRYHRELCLADALETLTKLKSLTLLEVWSARDVKSMVDMDEADLRANNPPPTDPAAPPSPPKKASRKSKKEANEAPELLGWGAEKGPGAAKSFVSLDEIGMLSCGHFYLQLIPDRGAVANALKKDKICDDYLSGQKGC